MGLFADRCEALIDPRTGDALTGAALEAAVQDPKTPRCGNRVPKAARVCNKCGHAAPGGWWKCHQCGKWVGNEARYCWNCKTRLHPEERDDINSEGWMKKPGTFAQRFHAADLKRLIEGGLLVQTGQAAILLEAGKVETVLSAGRHKPDSLARKINWWGNPPPRAFILVDAGDIAIPIRIPDLRTSEEIPIEFYTEVVLHFDEKGAEDFVANFFKDAAAMTYEDLARCLGSEVVYGVQNVCHTSTAEDLVKDPDRRLRVEDALTATLKTALGRFGLQLIRVATAEFTGKEYEELRQKAGEIEIKRRHLEFDQRLRELLSQDKMAQFKTEADLEEYVRQLAQERGVSEEHRKHEMDRLRMVHRHELEQDEASYQMAREMEQASHEIGVKLKWDDYTNGKLLKDAELKAQIATIEDDVKTRETLEWLKVQAATMAAHLKYKEDKARIARENLVKTAEGLRGMDLQTLIATIPDPAQRAHLIELNRQAMAAGKTPEQILAEQAATSPQAAAALAEFARNKREDLEKMFREQKEQTNDFVARYERLMKDALEATAKAAQGHGGGTQQIFR